MGLQIDYKKVNYFLSFMYWMFTNRKTFWTFKHLSDIDVALIIFKRFTKNKNPFKTNLDVIPELYSSGSF